MAKHEFFPPNQLPPLSKSGPHGKPLSALQRKRAVLAAIGGAVLGAVLAMVGIWFFSSSLWVLLAVPLGGFGVCLGYLAACGARPPVLW